MLIEIIPWQKVKAGTRIHCSSPMYDGEWYEILEVGSKWHEDSQGNEYIDISCVWHDGVGFRSRLYKRDTRSRIYED